MKYLIVTLLLLTACAQTEPLKIGVIAPLSGESALIGEGLKSGAEYAHLSTNGIELIIEDDQGTSAGAITAYHKLRTQNIDAVIGALSTNGNAIAPLAENDNIFFCSVAGDSAISQDRTYVINHWTTPEVEAQTYLDEARRLGWEHIVTLETQHPGVNVVGEALEEYADELTITRLIFQPDDLNAQPALLDLKDFDAFLLMAFPTQTNAFGKQIIELGFEQPRSAIESYEYIEDVTLFEGEWFVSAAEPTSVFSHDFLNAMGHTPSTYTGNGYDCYNILNYVLHQESSVSALEELANFPGAFGLLYNDNGRIQSPASIKDIVDGVIVSR